MIGLSQPGYMGIFLSLKDATSSKEHKFNNPCFNETLPSK